MACNNVCPANPVLTCQRAGPPHTTHWQFFKTNSTLAEYMWDDSTPNLYNQWNGKGWVVGVVNPYPPPAPPPAPVATTSPWPSVCGKTCPANPALVCEYEAMPVHTHLKKFAVPPEPGATYEYYWEDGFPNTYYRYDKSPSGIWYWDRKVVPVLSLPSEVVQETPPVQEPVEISDWDLLPDAKFDEPLMSWEEFLKVR